MRLLSLLSIWFLLFSLAGHCQPPRSVPGIIFDSDMGPDYDDVGAIAILHALADSGQARILATVCSTRYEGVAGIMEVFNNYFGRPGLPIGVVSNRGLLLKDRQHWTDTLLANYPHHIRSNAEVPSAVEVYRQVLAAQPDSSVIIVTTGFFTNLADLLQSKPDRYSRLDGPDLIKKKVRLLVSMAGAFPGGGEFNIQRDIRSSIYVTSQWNTPIIFSGYEIGVRIKTGLPLVKNSQIQHSPVKDVFRVALPVDAEDSIGRSSWDESAVWVAIKGCQDLFHLVPGRISVDQQGNNSWDPAGYGHFYLVANGAPQVLADLFNQLMAHQPMGKLKKDL